MRKAVGIMPLYDTEKDSYWMVPGYMKMLEEEQVVPMMLPLTKDTEELDYFLQTCQGFLLTGGQDVSPSLYHSERTSRCGECSRARDEMDKYILCRAVDMDKSVLGICRGIQLMNACFGGTLYQDLPTEHPGPVNHHMEPPYNRAAHQVTIEEDSLLYDILGINHMGVNSYHHQAVRELSPDFQIMAVSEDGLTEGIYMPSRKFVAGVQWHPEFSYMTDINSRKLIGAFADSL